MSDECYVARGFILGFSITLLILGMIFYGFWLTLGAAFLGFLIGAMVVMED